VIAFDEIDTTVRGIVLQGSSVFKKPRFKEWGLFHFSYQIAEVQGVVR
jgi:hypothetical protein